MDTTPGSDALHPNLARLAAQYDSIIDDMDAGRLTPAQARTQISQLETRDDHGIRWSIDPDTGEFIRKSAFGDLEYDTPPTSGVLTHDPFTLNNEFRDDDPNLRLSHVEVDIVSPPTEHFGATRTLGPDLGPSVPGALRKAPASQQIKRIAAAIGVALAIAGLALGAVRIIPGVMGDDSAVVSPGPSATPSATQDDSKQDKDTKGGKGETRKKDKARS